MKLKGRRILVVDDAPDVLDLFASLLRLEGAHVATAGTGREGLSVARQQRFDAVLTDLNLPDIPGVELIRRLHAGQRRPSKMAAVTAESEPALSRARQAGADGVFVKPVDVDQIVSFAASGVPGASHMASIPRRDAADRGA